MNDMDLFAKAVAFAAEKHKRQVRKDGTPYIYHPLKVAEMLKEAGYGLKFQIVAVLHDILEDTDATEEDIRIFGAEVLEAVKLVTRLPGADEDEYVAAILQNHMAAVVKNADKIHNMQDVGCCGDSTWGKKYVKKVKKYYEGKFSPALDDAIQKADETLAMNEPKKSIESYTPDEMMLYVRNRFTEMK